MSDTLKIANSIWPNGMKVDSDGHAVFYPLGTIKIGVPTSLSEWPKGNRLVSPYVFQDDKLVGFVDTKALKVSKNTTIYLPYEHIEADFSEIVKGQLQIHAPNATTKKASWKNTGKEDIPEAQFKYKGCKTVNDVKDVDLYGYLANIVNGTWSEPLLDLTDGLDMFLNCTNLISFNSDLPSLTDGNEMFLYCRSLSEFESDLSSLTDGTYMFMGCKDIPSFSSDLSSLTDGSYMFSNCDNLTSFSADLSSLTNGDYMFNYCRTLKSFSSDLSSLTNGDYMFYYTKLESFSSDLSSLTDSESMFNRCSNLKSFNSDLSSLTNGWSMFWICTNLTSFNSNLSSLTKGNSMFYGCKLDAHSVKNIIDTINTYSGQLTLGMGCNNTTNDKNLFAQEVGYADMSSLLSALQAKGWTVTAQYNGRPTTTYTLRRPSEDTLPVFVKLEESEDHADYTSLDDSKKFRLNYFHETTGSTDGYTQFNSLEEAIETLNIKPIENQ